MRYISTKDVAEILNLSVRRVVGLCNEKVFEGAIKEGRDWKIPETSVYLYKGIIHHDVLGSKNQVMNNSFSDTYPHMRTCAVGSTSYIDIVSNSYYVDKTLLIRDLIDDQAPVILFTRPRRFGKTLAIDMLKSYFEKSEKDTSIYFRDKMIWSCGEKYQEYQGAFPVISLTFKDAKFDNWDNTFEAIKSVIRDEFLRHSELFDSKNLNPVEHDYLIRIQSDQLSEVEYARALLNLGRMLGKHYQTKVVILIDEYDTPIQHGFARGFYHEVITFMRNFLSGGLKDSVGLAFGILTGILRVSKENLFSGLNNLVVNSILDEKYSEYFGFTEDEVTAIAAYFGRLDKLEEVRDWYDGYRFGNREIYNPWSVTNYFYHDCKARSYWINTSDNEIIHEMMISLTPEIAENLFSLVQGNTVISSLYMDIIYPEITEGADRIFSFLLIAGFLKPVGNVMETEFGSFMELTLPNKEIRRVYNTEILSWIKGTIDGNVMAKLEKALYLNNGSMLRECLQKYLITCISCFDGATEGFYHGMMLGLAAVLSSRYYIRSNRESGEGRYDLVLEPRIHVLPGIIMEFKVEKEVENLVSSARRALDQIEHKRYDIDMMDRGIKEIAKYGIAFSGKDVEIVQS